MSSTPSSPQTPVSAPEEAKAGLLGLVVSEIVGSQQLAVRYRSITTWPFSILKAIESVRWVAPDSLTAMTLPRASIVRFCTS